MERPPIFVVGLPRSGTTMLATMLSRHPAIDCGPETHFFRHLPADVRPLLDPTGWPDRAVDYVCGLRPTDKARVHERFGLDREAIRADLASRPPSLAAMLESLTAAHARAAGKPRWAEKTPGHLGAVPTIRRTFPDARIVRIVRDPRDTALSMIRVHWATESLLANLYRVATRDGTADRLLRADGGTMTIRFEDLVGDPPTVLERICRFVGEPFDPKMLEAAVVPPPVAGDESWKSKAAQAPDPSRVAVWRHEMDEVHQTAAAVVCSAMLERHGYPGAVPPRGSFVPKPDGMAFVLGHEDVALRLALAGLVVVRGTRRRHDHATLLLWPRQGHDRWHLGTRWGTRLRRLAAMASLVARTRLGGRPAIWIRDPAAMTDRPSWSTRAAELVLRVGARSMEPDAFLRSIGAPAAAEPHAALSVR